MINGKRIVVVLPAYNAAKTLKATVQELPNTVDAIILVDDHSSDETVRLARELSLIVEVHSRNYGYGGNQKTCYARALGGRRRHRRNDPPRLSIFAVAGHTDGWDGGVRRVRPGPRFPHARRRHVCAAECRCTST